MHKVLTEGFQVLNWQQQPHFLAKNITIADNLRASLKDVQMMLLEG